MQTRRKNCKECKAVGISEVELIASGGKRNTNILDDPGSNGGNTSLWR
jgi:hypothetical protein